MGQQVGISLNFRANTEQAKAQIEDLYSSLSKVYSAPNLQGVAFGENNIKQASKAALELSQHLQKSVDVDTGKLDLSRFSASLKASGKDLDTYYDTLLKGGKQGEEAFFKMAGAIATAEAPTARLNKQFTELWTTMKNTARWQLSSSMMHGFMSTVSKAYGYAQDLNKSLNNIRIVTGNSAEQMASFAKEANKAARALSTTTTEYTNASLIYYQQGLNEQEVKERTQTTIKLANVTGDSAQEVSNQMTAIWNNFYDGSRSIEYYADVITALGAATASSTDEISAGLEKFAGIAETVGLSYEYATAALATITAESREAPETVGTALKTIFARVQGLSLGETLEDGVNLNKYSAALAKVGVDVLDANGQLINMDDILEQLADKWETLGDAEKTALAQTVAGVRQYNQLMTLMNNWDKMEQNLDVAAGSEGALASQAKIYEESWQAAANRVKAATEDIYDSLINDKAFITILNGLEGILNLVGGLVDGFGGLGGVIAMVGSIFMRNFSKEIPGALKNVKQNFLVITGQAEKLANEEKQKSLNKIKEIKNAPQDAERLKNLEGKFFENGVPENEEDYREKLEELKTLYKGEGDEEALKEIEELEKLHGRKDDIDRYSKMSVARRAELAEMEQIAAMESNLAANRGKMSEDEIAAYQLKIDLAKKLFEENKKLTIEADKQNKQVKKDKEYLSQAGNRLQQLQQKQEEDPESLTQEEEQELLDLEAFKKETRMKKLMKKKEEKGLDPDEQKELDGLKAEQDYDRYQSIQEKKRQGKKISDRDTEFLESFENNKEKNIKAAKESKIKRTTGLDQRQYNEYLTLLDMEEEGLMDESDRKALQTYKNIIKTAKEQSEILSNEEITKQVGTYSASLFKESMSEDFSSFSDKEKEFKNLFDDTKNDETKFSEEQKKRKTSIEARKEKRKDKGDNDNKALSKAIYEESLSEMSDSDLKKFGKIQQKKAKELQKALSDAGVKDKNGEPIKVVEIEDSDFEDLEKLKEKLADLKAFLNEDDFKINVGEVSLPPNIREDIEQQVQALNQQIESEASSEQATTDAPEIGDIELSEIFGEASAQALVAWESFDGVSTALQNISDFASDPSMSSLGEAFSSAAAAGGMLYQSGLNIISLAPKISAFLKTINITLSANWVGAILGAISLLIAGLNWLLGQQERLEEKTKESISQLQEGKAKVEEYEQELKNIEERITEINAHPLDAVSATELANLEQRKMLLEEQLRIQQDINRLKAKEVVQNIANETNYGKKTEFNFDSILDEEGQLGYYIGNDPATIANVTREEYIAKRRQDALDFYGVETYDDLSEEAQENYNAEIADAIEFYEERVQAVQLEGAEQAQLISDYLLSINNAESNGYILSDAEEAMKQNLLEYFMQAQHAQYLNRDDSYLTAQMQKLYSADMGGQLTGVLEGQTIDGKEILQFNEDALTNLGIDASYINGILQNVITTLLENGFKEGQLKNLSFDQIMGLIAGQEGIERLGNTSQHGIMGYDLKQYSGNIEELLAETDNRTYDEKRAVADAAGEDAVAAYDLPLDEFIAYRDLMYEVEDAAHGITEEMRENPQLLNEMAIQVQRNIKGTQELTKNWQAFSKALTSKDLNEIAGIWPEMRRNLADITGLDYSIFEKIPATFGLENQQLIQDYLNGVTGAKEQLVLMATQSYIATIEVDVDDEQAQIAKDNLLTALQNMPDLEVGMTLNDTGLMSALQGALDAGLVTAEQMTDILNGITSEPTIEMVTVDAEQKVGESNGYVTYKVPEDPFDKENTNVIERTFPISTVTQNDNGSITYPVINGNAKITQTKAPSVGGNGGGGGGQKSTRNTSSSTRYHKQRNKIEDISKKQDKLSQKADRKYGKEKIDTIKEQTKALEEQFKVQNELVGLIKVDEVFDREQLDKQWAVFRDKIKEISKNAEFDELIINKENGIVENWSEVSEQLRTIFNGLEADAQKTFEESEKTFQEFFDLYHETHDMRLDEENALLDLKNQILDSKLNEIQTTISMKIEIDETELEWLDYQLKKIEDRSFSGAETLALINEKMSVYQEQGQAYQKGIEEILTATFETQEDAAKAWSQFLSGNFTVFEGKLDDAQIQQLKEYASSLMSVNESMMELRTEAVEKLSEAFEEWNEKFDQAISKVEHYSNIMTKFKDIVAITGKKVTGITTETISKLNEAIVNDSIGALKAAIAKNDLSQEELRIATEQLADAQARLADAEKSGNTAQIDAARQDIDLWTKQAQEASEGAMEASEALLDAWSASLEAAVTKFEESVQNAVDDFDELLGGEEFDNDFEKQKEMSDFYLKDYQKIYELSKMTRQINKSIDDTKSIAGKQKLKSLLQDINNIQEKGLEMTEYDLEYMQKQYDLRLAQIALEEAQNAKDTVRLQKDSEGNYSYVYTANTDEVEEAQQKYEDVLYEMQALSSEHMNELGDNIIDLKNRMKEEILALDPKEFETEEDYQKAIQEIEDYYLRLIQMNNDQIDQVILNNKELYEDDIQNWEYATGRKQEITEDFAQSYKDSILGMLTNSDSELSDFGEYIKKATVILRESLIESFQEYIADITEINKTISVDNMSEAITGAIDDVSQKSDEAVQSVINMKEQIPEHLNELIPKIKTFAEEYVEAIAPMLQSNEKMITSIGQLVEVFTGKNPFEDLDSSERISPLALKSEEEAGAASGGYTGDWGDNSGRLLWVHPEELILNPNDTLNMVEALKITREMLQTIDLNARQASMGLGSFTPATIKEEKEVHLEQSVTITAEFPNVQDKNEIQEAFNNLINTASQYANRK